MNYIQDTLNKHPFHKLNWRGCLFLINYLVLEDHQGTHAGTPVAGVAVGIGAITVPAPGGNK
jgi:hypothetical protein